MGKTTRLPSERAKELSSATGVPTPFVVAFEERFGDCDSAEDAIHSELEARGFRQSQNREFFRAKPNEVIRAIMDISSRSPTRGVKSKTSNCPLQGAHSSYLETIQR